MEKFILDLGHAASIFMHNNQQGKITDDTPPIYREYHLPIVLPDEACVVLLGGDIEEIIEDMTRACLEVIRTAGKKRIEEILLEEDAKCKHC